MTWIKVELAGKYWKIACALNLAKLLGLKVVYYSGGSR
jgi:hypothetical protein